GMTLRTPRNDAKFKKLLADAGDKLVVVQFYLVESIPRADIINKFRSLPEKYSQITFVNADVGRVKESVKKERIIYLPTFIVFKSEKRLATIITTSIEHLTQTISILEFDVSQVTFNDANGYKGKGNEYFKSTDYSSAIIMYSKAIEMEPAPTFYTNRAACYLQTKNFMKALEDCTAAIRSESRNLKAHFRASQAYLGLGNIQEAKVELDIATEIAPNDAQVRNEADKLKRINVCIRHGNDYLADQHYEDAILQFTNALSMVPMSASVRSSRAKAYLFIKKYQEAKKESLIVINDMNVKDPDAYFTFASSSYHLDNDLVNALGFVKQAILMDPEHAGAKKFIQNLKPLEKLQKDADAALSRNDYQTALDKLTELHKLDSNQESLTKHYTNMVTCAMNTCQYHLVIKYTTCLMEFNKKNARAYFNRGCARIKLKQYAEAIGDLETAIQVDPREKEYSNKLRECELELKKSKRKDYYGLLEVDESSDLDTIKKAYRVKAKEWHPDHREDHEREEATEKFKDVNEAYITLSDPEKRRRYDMGEEVDLQKVFEAQPDQDYDVQVHTFFDHDFDLFDVIKMYMFFERGGKFGGGHGKKGGPSRSGGRKKFR
ncbi:hypothetical protein AKO1_000285, partial [Acrasis kona]